jgi:hypothetical protein
MALEGHSVCGAAGRTMSAGGRSKAATSSLRSSRTRQHTA